MNVRDVTPVIQLLMECTPPTIFCANVHVNGHGQRSISIFASSHVGVSALFGIFPVLYFLNSVHDGDGSDAIRLLLLQRITCRDSS